MSNDYSLGALRGDTGQLWVNQPVPKNVTDPQTYKAARGFEAYFARYLINQMKGDMNLVGGKGYGGEIYQEMYVDSLGSQIASTGSLGITEMIYRQLMQQKGQEPYRETDNKLNPLEPAEIPVVTHVEHDKPPVAPKMARFYHHVKEAADRYGLDPELIYAVMQQESGGDASAVSKAGAKGLMQLMDTTATDMGVENSFSPRENILGGARYLREQLDTFGDLDSALAAYNAGPGAVKKYGGIPPYRETQDYVKKVSAIYKRIKAEVTEQLQMHESAANKAQEMAASSYRQVADSNRGHAG